jgi:CBS domain-containing protein
MKVKDVMTTDVLTVRTDTALKEAAALMAERGISGLPVVDLGGQVVGVLSEGDILFKETGRADRQSESFLERWLRPPDPHLGAKLAARTAGEAMSAPATTIAPNRPLAEAANTMIDQGIKRLPVVDVSGNLVGIVTRADLVRAFVRSDEAIEREIRVDVLQRALWIDSVGIKVVVERGEVRLSGQVENKAEAELIPGFVQRVPGVVSVLSKLTWPVEASKNGDRTRRLVRERNP